MKEFLAFVRKEFRHILRDKRTVLILLAMPIVQIILFGFALSNEVKDVRLAILNNSVDTETQLLINTIEASEYFELTYYIDNNLEIDKLLKSGKIDAAIVFPSDFAATLRGENRSDVQIICDATDPNTSSIYLGYLSGIIQKFQLSLSPNREPWYNIVPNIRLLYNPAMKASFNFVPGVMGLILTLICAMMTAISIVREKERGTMELLLVSPIKPISIIIAKCVPYLAISCIILFSILILSYYVLSVPIAGSLLLLGGVSLIFIFTALGLGLFISSVVNSQIAAMLISGMVLMMPSIALSGMMFPFDNMPYPLQLVGNMLPTKWYISATRKIMIEGLPFAYVAKEVIILTVMAVSLIALSLSKFKTRL